MRKLEESRRYQVQVGDQWVDAHWEQIDNGDMVRTLAPLKGEDPYIDQHSPGEVVQQPYIVVEDQAEMRYAAPKRMIDAGDVMTALLASNHAANQCPEYEAFGAAWNTIPDGVRIDLVIQIQLILNRFKEQQCNSPHATTS